MPSKIPTLYPFGTVGRLRVRPRKFDRSGAAMIGRPCDQCGQSFVPARADARFCSARCRSAAYRARRVAGKPDPVPVATEDPNAAQDATGRERRRANVDDQDQDGIPVVIEADSSGRPVKTIRIHDPKAAVHASHDPRVWHRLG